jgi:hypothetical protein
LSDTTSSKDRRQRVRRSLVTGLPLAIAGPGLMSASPATGGQVSASLPAPGTQRFRVYYGDMSRGLVVAEVDYRLDHRGDTYELSTRGEAVGMVAVFYSGVLVQNSTGRIGKGGLLPERYRERRGKRPERALRFDHARQLMIGLGEPPEVPLPPGTQDRLSVFYQVGLLARSRPFRPGERFTMPLASMKEIDVASFTVLDAESVTTARGPMPALHLRARNEADADDPLFDVWLATGLSMLPARIRVEESDGKVIDQVLLPTG